MGDALRVVLADDSRPFREGLGVLLATVDDIDVVAEAATGEEAIDRVAEHQPDVVLMDVNMPGKGGIECTRALVAAAPHVAVLVLSMRDDDEAVFSALRAGARGYVVKGAGQAELLRAIRGVGAGGAVFGASVARKMVDLLGSAAQSAKDAPFEGLTAREREILDLIAAGRSNAQIAETLVLSAKTVRNHVSSVFGKLEVADRSEAIVRARDAGFGTGPDMS